MVLKYLIGSWQCWQCHDQLRQNCIDLKIHLFVDVFCISCNYRSIVFFYFFISCLILCFFSPFWINKWQIDFFLMMKSLVKDLFKHNIFCLFSIVFWKRLFLEKKNLANEFSGKWITIPLSIFWCVAVKNVIFLRTKIAL